MDFLNPFIDFIKSLVINIGAFLTGKYAEKYDQYKEQLDIEKKRDEIDAKRSPDRDSIIDRMRNNGL